MFEQTLTLPLLAGTHGDALRIIAAAGLPANLTNTHVYIDAGPTLAATDSFADELVRALLIRRGAARLTINDVGTRLGHQLYAAAKQHDVTQRLSLNFGPFRPPI